jgi:hypothetical protein
MGLSAETLQIVHESVPLELRVLVVDTDVYGLFGAHLLAVTTEHTAELIDLVDQWIAVPFFIFTGY